MTARIWGFRKWVNQRRSSRIRPDKEDLIPKPKQSPKRVTRRSKTVSSLPEKPVIKPIDAVKFLESRARFAYASALFKDEDSPRTLRFARAGEWEFIRPVKKR
jgi:hypothetical protein